MATSSKFPVWITPNVLQTQLWWLGQLPNFDLNYEGLLFSWLVVLKCFVHLMVNFLHRCFLFFLTIRPLFQTRILGSALGRQVASISLRSISKLGISYRSRVILKRLSKGKWPFFSYSSPNEVCRSWVHELRQSLVELSLPVCGRDATALDFFSNPREERWLL